MYPDYNMFNQYGNFNSGLDNSQFANPPFNVRNSQYVNPPYNTQDMYNLGNNRYSNFQYDETTYNRLNQPPQQPKSEEIITLPEAIELIKKSIGNEKEDEMFYDEIIKQAPTEKEKNILRSIRDDERKHNRILRNLYFKFTGETLPDANTTINTQQTQAQQTNQIKRTYKDNLETALFGELEAVVKYRKIMGAMPNDDSYTLIMSIMTDEIRHACKYNFLIHSAR